MDIDWSLISSKSTYPAYACLAYVHLHNIYEFNIHYTLYFCFDDLYLYNYSQLCPRAESTMSWPAVGRVNGHGYDDKYSPESTAADSLYLATSCSDA